MSCWALLSMLLSSLYNRQRVISVLYRDTPDSLNDIILRGNTR